MVFSNYSVNIRFIVPDAATTARNLIANQTLFRINIACDLIYLVTVIVMFTSLYSILRHVNRNLAMVEAFSRFAYALMWGIIALNTFNALRLLGDASYLPVLGTDQLQTLARLHLKSSWDAYYVGLPFWGVASAVCGYLWLRSRYIPGSLAIFGIISSLWCMICAFIFISFPSFGETVNLYLFDMPLVIFEITLGFWLLFRGLSPVRLAQPNPIIDSRQQ